MADDFDPAREEQGPPPRRPAGGGAGAAAVKGSLLGAGVLLVLALLVIVNYLGWKYHARLDWTRTKIYSLSQTSENVLSHLDKDVQVTVFITAGSRLYEPTKELLSRYQAASPHLEVRWIDPARNPVEAKRLVDQYKVTSAGVVFEAGDQRRVVAANDLADLDFSGAQLGEEPKIKAFKGEEQFTSALVDLTQGAKPKVLFTTGHGELSLDDASTSGLQAVRQLLNPDNTDLQEWASLGAKAVPDGTSLVVIAGPRAAFTEAELKVLGTYLAGGGRLLVLLDPAFQPGGVQAGFADLGLGKWLADYGVKVGDDVVVDPSTTPPGFSAETFFATRYTDHPTTKALADAGIPVLVRESRSVGAGDAPKGATVTELMKTSADGWAVTRFEGGSVEGPGPGDLKGPVSLAVAVEATAPPAASASGADEDLAQAADDSPPAGDAEAAQDPQPAAGPKPPAKAEPKSQPKPQAMRLVVVGDSDLVSSAFLRLGPGNRTLANNLFNWLIERETLLGIPPKKPEQVRLSMTPSQERWSMVFVAGVLPLLAILLGLWVWSRRRRAL